MDEFFTVALAFVALHAIYGKLRFSEFIGLSLIPLVIDADHLLPLYGEGIKAFHSIFLISLLSLSIISTGYLKNSRRLERVGVGSYAVAVISLSTDLIEGDKIRFFYPISTQQYVSTPVASLQLVLYIAILIIVLSLSYLLLAFLRDDVVFRGIPHTGQES